MSRFHLSALLLLLLFCGGLAAEVAAGPPDPVNCDVPGLITLVARGADGTADPIGTFTVVARDFNGVPQSNWDTWLDFSGCPDIRLAADQHDPSVVVDCASHTIHKITVNGVTTFRVIGYATNLGASPGSIGSCVEVFSEGVRLGFVRVAALDHNGVDGVNPVDLSLFLRDSFSGQAFARSDYDGDGTLDPNDLSLWLFAYFAGGSAVSGGAPCP